MFDLNTDVLKRAKAVRLAIFDVDGVLTDGRLLFDLAGNEYKTFHAQDGQGLKLLRAHGIEVGVISGRSSPIVAKRLKNLGIQYVQQGQENKIAAYQGLLDTLKLTPEQTAHVGDDLPDIALMKRAGLAIAVADANPAVLPFTQWQTSRQGGHGAAREVCDMLLYAQGKLDAALQPFTNT